MTGIKEMLHYLSVNYPDGFKGDLNRLANELLSNIKNLNDNSACACGDIFNENFKGMCPNCVSELLAKVESKGEETEWISGEWQLCPKCNGTGRIYSDLNITTTVFQNCDVCNGAKVLVKPRLPKPPKT